MLGKKGGVGAWLFVLVSVFMVAVVYIILTEPWTIIYDTFSADLSSEYAPTATRIQNIWKNWPIITILSLIIAGFILMLRREPSQPGF
tara:strand:+ start:43 stop:306 length:264 start_codon:yes stop_codon:yes gene_type:complete